jgi:hypothetical protein
MEAHCYDDKMFLIHQIKEQDFNLILTMNFHENNYVSEYIYGNMKNINYSRPVMMGSCFVTLGLDANGQQNISYVNLFRR